MSEQEPMEGIAKSPIGEKWVNAVPPTEEIRHRMCEVANEMALLKKLLKIAIQRDQSVANSAGKKK